MDLDTIQSLHIEFYIMGRVLLLIVLIWLIYWVVIRLIAYYQSNQSKNAKKPKAQPGQNQPSNLKIVQCSCCGCHVPETESHLKNDRVICNSSQCNKP